MTARPMTARSKKLPYGFAGALLCLLLGACGFHLRGQVQLPPGVEPIYISGETPSDPLLLEVHNLLIASGISLASSAADARYKLVITQHRQERNTASLGEGARAAEYQLIESARFALLDPRGKVALGPNRLVERRIMPNDPNSVASTGEEEQLLRREMQRNLAAKITRRLRTFDYPTPPQPAQPSGY